MKIVVTKLIIGINFIALIVIIVAGFWPFDFKPPNNIYRLNKKNGIVFKNNSIVYEPNVKIGRGILSYYSVVNELGIEFLFKPLDSSINNISTILSFYDENDPEIFMIAQWKSNLILRRRITQSKNKNTYHENNVPNVIFPGKKLFVVVILNSKSATVYIDGIKKASFSFYPITTDDNKYQNSRIMLGNNPAIKYPFHGEIYGLAIYNRTLNEKDISKHYLIWNYNDLQYLKKETGLIAFYPMNERSGSVIHNIVSNGNNMIIPDNLYALKKTFLGKPWRQFWKIKNFYYDLAINICGFIPLGFLLLTLFVSHYERYTTKYSIITILVGSSVSLFIELVQAYLPARSSDIIDLISNSFGTILGVIIFHIIYNHYRPKMKKTGLIRF
ncbi:MAG: hypothetical protein A2176_10495 [Spirochaetes bacterium RBG_13_51_14]|nr:MAG: hypothetical protein A2176_10495 [Spirochaetes bacterium RBG_13_51_14]